MKQNIREDRLLVANVNAHQNAVEPQNMPVNLLKQRR